ncbi:arginine exporter protein ArgO [Cytobacillus horneckiae]|uniref:YlaF family protein n=1 Tax=Cytobacillus horneckiae TaxID=549687 RepID=A0A2N0ZKD7_9BACI|nr:YlaF family protein [Cytobacillus horneckiae]NRG46530.1 YlaF family protein [Bacillus sp. CRN 9]MBN6889192.1 YlaF family protein [Cytobacillus horneckiae]MCM3178410.1 YlaF family protein [Cytobacillus horneckiae]MEC1156851.1 YlaF family protein [Cytobacillus horneckiae]MED2940450.1 YlaF family protein [Cytobacillus horneckiae]
MKRIKWPLLGFAIAAAVCIGGIGIAIGERSILGILLCIVGIFVVMGFGFKTKKKMRENGEL